MTSDDRTLLNKFFSSHFGDGWTDVSDDPDEIVRGYLLVTRSPVTRERLAAAMERRAAASSDDAALDRELRHDLGCQYDPCRTGSTARAWLRHVAAILRQAR